MNKCYSTLRILLVVQLGLAQLAPGLAQPTPQSGQTKSRHVASDKDSPEQVRQGKPRLDRSRASKPITILGKIEGEITSVRELKLVYYDTYVLHAENVRSNTTVPAEDGSFTFTLPPTDRTEKLSQLLIYYRQKLSNGEYDHDVLSNYVIEPGDSVMLRLTVNKQNVDTVIVSEPVSGHGTAKYQCRAAMESIYRGFEGKRIALDKELGTFDPKNLPRSYDLYRSSLSSMLAVLQQYQGRIQPRSYQIMEADAISSVMDLWEHSIAAYRKRTEQKNKEETHEFYQNHPSPEPAFSDDVVALSPGYVDYLIQRQKTRLAFQQGAIGMTSVTYNNLYYDLRSRYSGQLRERMLMLLIVDPFKNAALIAMGKDGDRYIEDALAVIRTRSLRTKIQTSTVVVARKGVPAYEFALRNTSGKMVSLHELRGNVILMEMWETGCTGCVLLARKVREEVLPELKTLHDYKRFRIVSICTDGDRSMWKKSLESGKYSSPESIDLNLPTEGSAAFFGDPMISHYGLLGLPFALLIDQDGNIVSQVTNDDKGEDIVRVVKTTLEREK